MTPRLFSSCLAGVLAGSLALEAALLSGLTSLPAPVYHLIHLGLMAGLLAMTLALYRDRRRCGGADAAVVLLFAAGLVFTAVGDFVNSALSGVDPVTHKLRWALLLFGLGYACYTAGMLRGLALPTVARPVPRLWWLIPVILVINVTAWISHVHSRVQGDAILTYGSFVFNATLYVVLPWLAIRYLVWRRFAPDAVLVAIGSVLIPFSDLVLFNTWLGQPDGAPVSLTSYSSNWILYFGGQCLINVFPSALAADRGRS